MNRKMKQEKLAKQISLAIMAGMVTYTPVAFGMPMQDTAKAPTTGVNIQDDIPIGMGITSTAENNVIYWTDFSIEAGKTVKFDYDADNPDAVVKNHNYANIVTGAATSFINGAMEGGKNVYLINPNGVIFGKDAQVNVGNLYVSTQGKVDTSKFNDQEANPVLSVSGTPACDVVNLGTIKADTVEVVGNNIRFLNAAQIQDKDGNPLSGLIPGTTDKYKVNVTANANGYIHVGHENSATDSGYKVNGGTLTEYQLVHNLTELQAMNGSNNYMLADDINKGSETKSFTPIDNFSGNFDGMFYTINKLAIKRKSGEEEGSVGLFASTSGNNVHIENVGLVNSSVEGYSVDWLGSGAIVGAANAVKTEIKNVYVQNTSVQDFDGEGNSTSFGGLVGLVGFDDTGSKVQNSSLEIDTAFYDSGTTSGCIGNGILGLSGGTSVKISNVYSKGTILGDGIAGQGTPQSAITNAYTSAATIMLTEDIPGTFTQLTDSSDSSYKQKKVYSDVVWDISDTGGVTIDPDTGNVTKAKWRIYAGQSLPMLTAFFKGTVQADYTYSMGDSVSDYTNKTSNETIGISADKQGNVTAIYNGGTVQTGGVSALKHLTDEQKALISYAGDKKKAEKSQDDATTNYALFYSTQQGYDIAGSNFTITKRKVDRIGGDDPSL